MSSVPWDPPRAHQGTSRAGDGCVDCVPLQWSGDRGAKGQRPRVSARRGGGLLQGRGTMPKVAFTDRTLWSQ